MLGGGLMQVVGQNKNIVSVRLDINVILKCLKSIWDDKPGAWLYVVM